MLRDPAQDSINRQRTYALVIAHEMAHQWFGDLVTTAWWNDIWLNEAFASWMDSKIMRQWKPEWNTVIDEQGTRLGAMGGDELISARKIRQPIESNDDIANAFDGITYSKGEAVIGMFENWMGEDAFRRGVQRYIRQYAWRNATAGDFLDAISSEGRPVGRAFSTFLDQAGVPLVSVKLSCGAAGGAALHLSQKRALPLGSAGSTQQTWQVPVCVRYGDGAATHRECTLLSDASMDWKLAEAKACPAWVEGNADGKGYYLTRYEGDLLDKLLSGGGHVSPAERVAAMGDVDALTGMGEIKSADALALAVKFASDPVRQVVESSRDIISGINDNMVPKELRPNYDRLIDRTFGARAHELGWKAKAGEDAETRLLRSSIVPLVAQWGSDGSLAAEARRLAALWLTDRTALDADIAGWVLDVAARTGDETFYKQLLAGLARTQDRHQRDLILRAMGSFSDPRIARASMELVLKPDFDLREAAGLLLGPGHYPETRYLPFEFVKANFDAIAAKIPAGSTFGFGDSLPFVGSNFCDERSAEELKAFFDPKVDRFAGTRRNLAQVLEGIRICTAYKAAQQDSVADFLKKY
jgi:alanyl aminopeptidase